jgi:epoxyqueuosine reductase
MGVPSAPIKQAAIDAGFTTVGISPAIPIPLALNTYRAWLENGFHGEMSYLAEHEPLKTHPENLLPGAKSVVAVTLNYYQPQPENLKIARYAIGRDYHKVLRQRLRIVEQALKQSHPGSETRICVDSAPILDRGYASLAGLGWFGKNTMLIDSRRGSWFFIGLLLTTLEIEVDHPSVGGCGTCRACIDACPTGAIVQLDGRWQIDARKCISYQTIERKGDIEVDTAGWVFGCDVCQEVCPFNIQRESQPLRAQITQVEDFYNRRGWPTAKKLTSLDEDDWDALTQGSAVRRAGYGGLRRNALKVVGDSAE